MERRSDPSYLRSKITINKSVNYSVNAKAMLITSSVGTSMGSSPSSSATLSKKKDLNEFLSLVGELNCIKTFYWEY